MYYDRTWLILLHAKDIFNSTVKDAYDRIADFFYDLECQYHLVPLNSHSRPRVPALTPVGFVQYITTCILAHPDEEFRRLDKIVTDVQLVADTSVAADGQPEKLPRQLLRSQFPVTYNPRTRKILAAALDDLQEDLGIFRLSSPKSPLTIMPPPNPEERDSISGVRRYAPPGKLYARRDGYILPANSESKSRSRYLPPAPLKTVRDGKATASTAQNRDYYRHYGRSQTPYEEGRDSYEGRHGRGDTTPPSTPQLTRHYTTSPRASQIGPLTTTSPRSTATTPRTSSTTIYIPINTTQNATAKASTSTSTSTGTSVALCRRARSPPLQAHRASTLDVRSAPPTPGASYSQFKYFPPPPTSPVATVHSTSLRADGTGSRDGGSSNSSSGPAEVGPHPVSVSGSGNSRTRIAVSTPTTPTPSPTTSTAVIAAPSSSSPSLPTNASPSQGSTRGGRRALIASPTSSSTPSLATAVNAGEKNHHHHHHSHRRSAAAAVESERGPTWEEALKSPTSHHHRTGSSSSKGGSRHHYRHHSSH